MTRFVQRLYLVVSCDRGLITLLRSDQCSPISRHGGRLRPGEGSAARWDGTAHGGSGTLRDLASPTPVYPQRQKVLTVSYCTLALLALTHTTLVLALRRSIHITVKVVLSFLSAPFFHSWNEYNTIGVRVQ
jgi:hypothetical protein